MIVTLVHHLLEEFVSDHQFLPRKLHLNLGQLPRLGNGIEMFKFFVAETLSVNNYEK